MDLIFPESSNGKLNDILTTLGSGKLGVEVVGVTGTDYGIGAFSFF